MLVGDRRHLVGAVAAVALLTALAFAGSASACTCAPLTAKSVKQSDAAAVMTLEDVDETGGGIYEEGSGKAAFTYTVGRVYSGRKLEKGDSVTISSSTSSAACGLPKREGRRYGLLSDSRKNGNWVSSLCDATTPKKLRRLSDGKRGATRPPCR